MQIISGKLKGRKIALMHSQKKNLQMRPTTAYTKSVLFNLLNGNNVVQISFEGKTVLDCFCGTGAVGFEFASRGARAVHFVDSDETNIAQIHKNAQEFGIEYEARVGFFPKCKIKEKFDVIFMDPPYIAAQSQVLKTIESLTEHSLAQNGMLVIETENSHTNLIGRIGEIVNIILDYKVSDTTRLVFCKPKNVLEK